MKSRFFALAAAVVLCAGMTGCGESEGKDSGKMSGSNSDSKAANTDSLTEQSDGEDGDETGYSEPAWTNTYVYFHEIPRQNAYHDFDSTIHEIVEKNQSAGTSSQFFKLSDRKFEYNVSDNAIIIKTYKGTYKKDDCLLKLDYKQLNIIDNSKNAAKLSLSNRTINITDTEDDLDTPKDMDALDEMKTANEKNTILTICHFEARNNADWCGVPFFLFDYDDKTTHHPIFKTGSFLSYEAYGTTLDGNYQSGKDFTLKYNPISVLMQNPYSNVHDITTGAINQERLNELKTSLHRRFRLQNDNSNFNMTIHFSNGSWYWVNEENQQIDTQGKYQESKEYPGLILIYGPDLNQIPAMIYIADDGNVYLPVYIEAEL